MFGVVVVVVRLGSYRFPDLARINFHYLINDRERREQMSTS